MPRPLEFKLGEETFSLQMSKVDRAKLYGSKDVLAIDEQSQTCELATLASDGKTVIGKGGTGLLWLDADGSCADKADLLPVDINGDKISPVASSFGQTIELFETATPEDYLQHNIRLVYQMSGVGADDVQLPQSLLDELGKGTIFRFSYSYRGGLEADTAFLLNNAEGQVMMVVGTPATVNFVGIQSQPTADQIDESSGEADDLMSF